MVDYTRSTGSSGTMMVRDTTGPLSSIGNVEFWITSNNSSTFTDHLPWSWNINGSSGSGSFNYPAGGGWRRLGVWSVSKSQNVTFSIGNSGTSGFGGPTSMTIGINRATVPPAPGPVRFDSITSTSVHAVFDGNGDGGAAVDKWQIHYGTSPVASEHIVDAFNTVITGLTPGTTYYFWSLAHNGVGYSAFGPRTQMTTLRVPDAPTMPMLSNIQPTTVDVSWTPNGDGGSPITGFEVGYGTNDTTPDTVVSATSPKTITGLIPGTIYYFWARALNAVGASPWSAVASNRTIAGARIKVSGVWKIAIPYVRVSGVWKQAIPYVKNAGEWKATL